MFSWKCCLMLSLSLHFQFQFRNNVQYAAAMKLTSHKHARNVEFMKPRVSFFHPLDKLGRPPLC